jgi:hypothetical protein
MNKKLDNPVFEDFLSIKMTICQKISLHELKPNLPTLNVN